MSEHTLLTQAAATGPVFNFVPSQRYPDPRVEVLHPSFAKLRIFSSTVELLGSGMRWAEGPVWFGDGRYLLVSDIPNNRIMRYDEATGAWGVFRQPSNMANGLVRDMQGRLLACEHGGRRITRTEYDGSITVLADRFEGKRLNSPNDIVSRAMAPSGSPIRPLALAVIGRVRRLRLNCRTRSTALIRQRAPCGRC